MLLNRPRDAPTQLRVKRLRERSTSSTSSTAEAAQFAVGPIAVCASSRCRCTTVDLDLVWRLVVQFLRLSGRYTTVGVSPEEPLREADLRRCRLPRPSTTLPPPPVAPTGSFWPALVRLRGRATCRSRHFLLVLLRLRPRRLAELVIASRLLLRRLLVDAMGRHAADVLAAW